MSVQASVCFLIVCASFGTVVGDIDDYRRRQELTSMPANLSIYDCDGELVEITSAYDLSTNYTGEVTFTLYTYNNQLGSNIQLNDTTDLETVISNVNSTTYFVTHGWRDKGSGPACTSIRDAYLSNDYNNNVIVVDWSVYSLTINYLDASSKVSVAAEAVADMINYLYELGLDAERTTLIGHSLGAHVVGIAGHTIWSKYRKTKLKHIVGLDPALPMFNFAGAGDRLTVTDAQNVQIIHTNGGLLGYLCSQGRSDFYPNGGSRQTGCCDDVTDLITCPPCSHRRAYLFYAESIENTFNGTRCDTFTHFLDGRCSDGAETTPMGGRDLDVAPPGKYYLWTGSEEPYYKVKEIPDRTLNLAPVGHLICSATGVVPDSDETLENVRNKIPFL